MNCANCGREIVNRGGYWSHDLGDGTLVTDCRLSATPPGLALTLTGDEAQTLREVLGALEPEGPEYPSSDRNYAIASLDDLALERLGAKIAAAIEAQRWTAEAQR